ncbi:polysaccharide deacetylase family protein [Ginsengibacter hankyongi]|uniref:Polysaccharide deacetylase family protein n=1 Tax=Ginsengibacter hankyongi TaxID=2607284 RepID=A0A5J5IC10_9BACT|nr:polysaccharide deacetylase family protein [Ginsengibacter hankyongi]KAA9035454.1 polysaccharide deacetylase family protein [Ginsengibacter hankyongi]
MNILSVKACLCFLGILFLNEESYCQTTITKWQFDKKAAVSITYDDGIPTQFTEAIPIMNRLQFPGTFFIVTGDIKGSRYHAKFIGRPVKEIMNETKTVSTNKNNFFERASAAKFLGYKGTTDYFFRAGSLYEEGKPKAAYKIIDSVYTMALAGLFKPGIDTTYEAGLSAENSWSDFKRYAAQGHEFACHSLSHPYMAILDTPNMYYELQKCKEDIRTHLGDENTFSAEVPFGTEDERVMEYVLQSKLFPALRNKMPEPYLQEINRGYKEQPGLSKKEYVQWQRGPLSKTQLSVMKSWVDTLLAHNNIWLVLVFHGIDTLGWEPINHEELVEYFQYIKNKEDSLWVATFKDVTKYMRERMAVKVTQEKSENKITLTLLHSLDTSLYNLPLTLKTYLPASWKGVNVHQNNKTRKSEILKDDNGKYVLFQANPNKGKIELTKR